MGYENGTLFGHTTSKSGEVYKDGIWSVSSLQNDTRPTSGFCLRTAEELIARERREKSKDHLLMASYQMIILAKFHKMTNAKRMWDAIKSRFGEMLNPRRCREYILNAKFEGFSRVDSLSFDDLYHKSEEFFEIGQNHSEEDEDYGFDGLQQLKIRHRGYDGILSYENEVLQSVFMNKESELEKQPLYDRFVTAGGMHAVPPPMTGNYMPSGPDIEVDYSQFTYGPKQTQPSESESQTSEFDTCDSNISTEPSELVSEPVVNESNVECQPKVWSDAPIIEEYESDSEDEETVKNQFTHSQKPKVDKKELGYGFTVRACFVCGSLNHLIRDCDFHEKRMARKAELNYGRNNVQRVNKQNQFVPAAVLTRTDKISVNTTRASGTKHVSTTRQSFNRQTVLTSTAMKINTLKPNVNRVVIGDHKDTMEQWSPYTMVDQSLGNCYTFKITRQTPSPKTGLRSYENSNLFIKCARTFPHRVLKNKGIVDSGCSKHMTGNKAYLAEFQDFNGGPVALEVVKVYIIVKEINTRPPVRPNLVSSISQPLQLLHMDLFGPTSVRSINHKTYCLVITDDFSRFSWVFFLRTKDETSGILKDFIRQIENQLNQKVKTIRCDNGTEFKNRDIIEFCGSKGIKREYSNARTPQQNGVAERKNRTLIEAARTMLADSFLPNTFWAEAVSTACYVLNRVLVTKPQNKTPYELITGKIPIISYIRPFGCHVTILNTIDHLGKFEEKSDEGFLVGYSLNSKAFRVYNLETKRVEENLHINFLENKPNVAGKGPNWLFDLDYLTDSMNYQPVTAENKANKTTGPKEANHSAGTQDNIDAGNSKMEAKPAQEYFVLPLWSSYTSIVKSSEAKNRDKKPNRDTGPKTNEKPKDQEDQAFLEELERLKRQEKEANDAAEAFRKEFAQCTKDLLLQAGAARATSTNTVNTVSTPISTASPSRVFSAGGPDLTNNDQDDSQIPALEEIYDNPSDGIFTNASYDDKGAVADFTNLETTVNVSPIPTSRIHSIHPTTQILGDPTSAVQTRSKVNKSSGAHAFVSYIQKQRRNNHKDFQHCLFACFLSQIEPKKISQALEDESWVDAMQEELLQFKIQKVWILVDLPFRKKAIRTKWVYRNKKDERGVVVRNKARLVAQGYRQEERIDYDEVFAPVARIEAIRIFLAFASYMGFIVYQMDVKSAFLYGTIDEDVYSGYKRGTIDKTLFIKKDRNDIMLVHVYVDDIICGSTKKSWCDEFEALMKSIFQMSSIGELTFFLGLQVQQKEDGIFISQDKYVVEILKKFDSASVKTASTPIETQKPLIKDEEAAIVANISDYAGANLDMKSITGGFQFLSRRLILWQRKKQTIVATSTTEAEYVAAANYEENTQFHEIVDFLTRSYINYALTVSPIVSTSFVEQFWNSATSKTINNVSQINAKVADKPVTITKASIRRDLLFNDADGIDCLSNQAIFDNLSLMGYEGDLTKLTFQKALFSHQWKFLIHTIIHCLSSKSTSWDQFPTNIASAVICLATNQTFNFSKMIFDGMMRHLDAKKKFIMYPRFIQVFLNKQLKNIPAPLDHFPTPVLTKKVFSFMIKQGLNFSGRVTSLFPSMLTQAAVEEGEGSAQPTEPQPTPSSAHPSLGDQPHVPESSSRPANTHSPSINLEGTSGSERDQVQLSHDSPLSGGHTSDKAEGGLNLDELLVLCTNLSNRVLALETSKDAQTAEILKLKTRIKKLEKKCKPSISHHRAWLRSVSRLSRKKKLGQKESVPKQGRKNAKPKSTLDDSAFNDPDVDLAHGIDDMEIEEAVNEGRKSNETKELNLDADTEVIAEDKGSGEKGGSTVSTTRPDVGTARQEISTADLTTPPTTTTIFDDEEMTLADTLVKMKDNKAKGIVFKDTEELVRPARSVLTLKPLPSIDPKDKGKGVLEEPEPAKKMTRSDFNDAQVARDAEVSRQLEVELQAKVERERQREEQASMDYIANLYDEVQARIDVDHELAVRLTHEEQEKYIVDERAKLLAEFFERRKKQLVEERVAAIRNKPLTRTQLRSLMMTYLKHTEKTLGKVLKMKARKKARKPTHADSDNEHNSEKDETNKKDVVESSEKGTDASKKRKGGPRMIRQSKRKKTDSDLEEEGHLKTFLNIVLDEEGIIDFEVLEKRFPIINWELKFYHFDRHGAECIYYRIFRSDGSSRWIKTFYEMVTRTMFKANAEDELWQNQEGWNFKSWDFYENCGVHTLTLEDGTEIHMIAERRYPLIKETLERMMSLKLIDESASDSAYDVLRFIQKQVDEAGSHDGGEKDI
ncbi:putative ribonuclease H-like domain-containing protein [Tanacetum coccineum]